MKQGAATKDLLQALWQAAWLDLRADERSSTGSSGGEGTADLVRLRESLLAAQRHFPGFLASLEASGWDLSTPPVLQLRQTRLVVSQD